MSTEAVALNGTPVEEIAVTPDRVRVKPLAADAIARWDRFVTDCPEATFFHRAGWQAVIGRAFGHPTYYLYAEADGRIEGVLPLGQVKSRLFGNALISVPFGVYGGVAARTPRARRALEDAACELAESLRVDYLELRNRQRCRPDWPCKDGLYVTFRKELLPEAEANLKAMPRKQRAMVRKGIQAGLRAEIDTDTERFFEAYSTSVRNLGTPVLSRAYYRLLKDVFGEDCEVLTVTTAGGGLVSSVLSFYFRDEVLPYYGGGNDLARDLKGNDFMYWELMRRACERGIRVFDYGRSKRDTGSYRFKRHWGFEPEPLYYEYHLVKARTVPEINPLNPKYRLFVESWKRLPLPVSRLLGPWVARSLG